MHKIYEEEGDFNFIYNIPQILYSLIICAVINEIVKYLSLTEKNIVIFKNENEKNKANKGNELIKCLKINFFFLFLLIFLLLFLFWYYLGSFCAVYKNTQIHLIKETLISFRFSLILPFGICLLFAIFRIISLRAEKKDRECLYKFSKLFY